MIVEGDGDGWGFTRVGNYSEVKFMKKVTAI